MPSVTIKFVMLSVLKLNVLMLSAHIPNVLNLKVVLLIALAPFSEWLCIKYGCGRDGDYFFYHKME